MPFTNSTEVRMYNFTNKNYLNLLADIVSYFKYKEYFGFDDSIIRFDEETQLYVASIYLLDAQESD